VQCHLQQEHEMQCRGTLRRLLPLWPFLGILDTRVLSQVGRWEVYGGQCGNGEGSSPSTSVSACQCLATNDPYAFIHQTRYMTLQMRESLNNTLESSSCVSFFHAKITNLYVLVFLLSNYCSGVQSAVATCCLSSDQR
jgi:hypothetical protein